MSYEIVLNEEKLKKASKKFLAHLNKIPKDEYLKLSNIQEILAKSLGYRSLHELQQHFTEEEKPIKYFHLKDLSANQLLKIFNIFNDFTQDMWTQRAKTLLKIVLEVLEVVRNKDTSIKTNDDIMKLLFEYISLNKLIKFYKNDDISPLLKRNLRIYFESLPGFQEHSPKQSSTVEEQHSYLSMQLHPIFDSFREIIEINPILIDTQWIAFTSTNSLGRANLKFTTTIENLDSLDDSWLLDAFFNDLVHKLHKNKSLSQLTLLDMMLLFDEVVNEEKQLKMKTFIKNIVNNIFTVSKISKKIQATC